MARELAFSIGVFIVGWLFVRDQKLRPLTSKSLWLPFIWISVIGSKSINYWLGAEINMEDTESYLEGSPLDRNLFLTLILLGGMAILRRRIEWSKVIYLNPWLFGFFLYWGLSIVWSDYPFISFKRFIKDIGNIVMILIILTEPTPYEALKAIFARYSYLAIVGSVLLIIFFPELGIHIDKWSRESAYIGITSNKNELGVVLVVTGIFLVNDFIELNGKILRTGMLDYISRLFLIGALLWLLKVSNSDTALICFPLGALFLILMRFPFVRVQFEYLGLYSMIILLVVMVPFAFPGILDFFLAWIGRDITLSGRTDIWASLLEEPINPIIGRGYSGFWLGSTVDKYDFIIQAHNGYLETYLNGGLIGIFLLAAVIIAGGGRLKAEVMADSKSAGLLISIFATALIYDFTEAMFNRLTLIWFVLLIAIFKFPKVPFNDLDNSGRLQLGIK